MNILLAEDNPTNQLLATRLLEKRGHHVTATSNGREALAELAKKAYDLVFMDVQMPEMDGIEATVALREKEKVSGAHQPVIALTAMVIKGDRERCLAAGMDGYLSKPIRAQELDEILDGYVVRLGETTVPTGSLTLPAAKSVDEAELLERLGGDLEFLSELTRIFRDDYPKQLSSARQAIAAKDAEGVKRAGHALRGALANLAANGPCSTAATIEEIGTSGDLSTVGPVLAQLEKELAGVLESLEALCQETGR